MPPEKALREKTPAAMQAAAAPTGTSAAWSALGEAEREAARASLERRLGFMASWRHALDGATMRRGGRGRLAELAFSAGAAAFDLVETVRMRALPERLGRAHLDAIAAPVRLPQDPRYRAYWYDPERHSLVGLPVGLDLHHHDGVFHVIESNVAPGMRPERRELFETEIDPLIGALAETARRLEFETLVLCRRHWSAAGLEELRQAERAFGLRIVGRTVPSNEGGASDGEIIRALPEPLAPRTFYVLLSPIFMTPLIHFLNDKAVVGQWLPQAIAAACGASAPIASVPSYDRLVLPETASDPRWPNLVVKLAAADRGHGIVMGRFESEADARRHLGLDAPGQVPRVLAPRRAGLPRLRPAQRVIYQPFVPPPLVGGRACVIRLHVLISPLVDAFLWAHGKVASEPVPDRLPEGIIADRRPFIVNVRPGVRYIRPDERTQAGLRDAALAYGKCAGAAIRGKFQTGPEEGGPA